MLPDLTHPGWAEPSSYLAYEYTGKIRQQWIRDDQSKDSLFRNTGSIDHFHQ